MNMSTPYIPATMARIDIDNVNRGFYDACKNRQLTIQRCTDCGHSQHPPRPICPNCHSSALEWHPVSGRGTVYTYTIVHHPVGDVADRVPFNVVSVQLDDLPEIRMVSNLVDTPPEGVVVGQSVEVMFEEVTSDLTLPRFRRVSDE
jgi:uncharacterized OB-fold protein